ncbi:hypothetical protein SAMN05444411_1217 [Lutibacter oricola]|uniref:Uncharacterized protein n=1 Tax=Lutibacter oricola TaxID=762486 RepID=A0A1H3H1R0_9FLAO|nr:hypothetical protein [Lutibacter oricola]SDY08579.1 hypothetical protein SAMN05444411_1217 [Lutibacter oricola]
MNIYFLIAGVLIFVLSTLYLIYTIKSAQKDKDYDSMIYSFDVNIVLGTIVFIVIGLIMIYRELKYLIE